MIVVAFSFLIRIYIFKKKMSDKPKQTKKPEIKSASGFLYV